MTTTTNPAAPRAGRPTDVAKSRAHSGAFRKSVAFRLRLRRLPSVGFVWILSHGRLRRASRPARARGRRSSRSPGPPARQPVALGNHGVEAMNGLQDR